MFGTCGSHITGAVHSTIYMCTFEVVYGFKTLALINLLSLPLLEMSRGGHNFPNPKPEPELELPKPELSDPYFG